MQEKEYLVLFSNDGEIEIDVKLNGSFGAIASRRMRPAEITNIISDDGGGFASELTIDEWPIVVKKYEINPQNNHLIIHAEK